MSRTDEPFHSRQRGLPLLLATVVMAAVWSGCCGHSDGGGSGGGTSAGSTSGGGTSAGGTSVGGTSAGVSSLIGGGWNSFQGMATTNFYGLFHGFRGTAYDEVESRVGAAGAVTAFSAAITAAPPTGSWTFTMFKNGAPQTVTCSITGANTSCTDVATCVELSAGDEIAVQVVPTGATANAGGPRWTAVFAAGGSCP